MDEEVEEGDVVDGVVEVELGVDEVVDEEEGLQYHASQAHDRERTGEIPYVEEGVLVGVLDVELELEGVVVVGEEVLEGVLDVEVGERLIREDDDVGL